VERRHASCLECGYCAGIGWTDTGKGKLAELGEAELRGIAAAVVERVTAEITGVPSRLVPVAVSARHVHLTREVLDATYGKGHQLTRLRDLSQRGQFAAEETLTIVGSRMHSIEGVRVLGPVRDYTQAELARTDGITLGLELPVRGSGRLGGSAPIVLIGPKGAVSLKEGGIRPTRHLHARPEDARRLGLRDGQSTSVRVPGEKGVIFENVIVRVDPSYVLEMHLDTDDANAADLHCGMFVEIV
jgi:putative phosphotransacetylase